MVTLEGGAAIITGGASGIDEALRRLPVVSFGECVITRGPYLIVPGKSRALK